MQKLKMPENELARLSILKKYSVLDTSPEKIYDNIAYLAAQICETPIALVSLIDEKRQWIKSRFGLEETQISREISFCGHAILEKGTFQIPNSNLDPRFSDNPLVTGDPKFIFYAGAPLKTRNGQNVGTLCVIDHKPRQPLTPEQIHSLELLAEQVVELFELRLVSRHAIETTKDLAETFESMHDAFFSVDKNWIVTHVNQKMAAIVKSEPKKLININFLEQYFSSPKQKETINYIKYMQSMLDRQSSFFEGYNHDLKIFSEVKIYPKADGGLAVFFKDITKEKDTNKALMDIESSFQSITEATPLIVWTSTPAGQVDYANSKWYEYTGFTPAQTMGFNFTNAIHPDDVAKTMELFGNSLSTLVPLEIEHRFQRVDGNFRWFLTRALPSLDAS
ncbi:MAG: PAS domain S-box protein, partial [Bdellovibrionaceae bacterium]|nr:PAS domain S-box protein [Pseudobdellovibrionaceae bacterium]